MGTKITGKYLKYAIGEIILVVIGILIALQINNWNENRKLNLKLTKSLKEIRRNLVGDSIPIFYVLKTQRKDVKMQRELIAKLESKELLDSSFNEHFGRVLIMRRILLVDNGYNTLKKLGMEQLKDDAFEKQIVRYYNILLGNLNSATLDDETEFLTDWRPYLINNFKDWKFGEYGIPNDYQNLSDDSRLLMMLKMNLGNRESTLQSFEIIQKDNTKLINAIDNYLKE
ncbi:DUF6090 family protein [Winogradskyella sp. MIT101101]|uniref:DUF6090 family protein n=1 Tax=Winogradskyella sp. MIT101101 TaxID=3098297 RepID=UPI00399BF7C7